MRRSEDMNVISDSCFDEAATWHARWQDAPSRPLSPEEVDRWAQWSQIPGNKRAFDAVEFVARAKYSLEPPPLPTPEELAADDSDVQLGIRSGGGNAAQLTVPKARIQEIQLVHRSTPPA